MLLWAGEQLLWFQVAIWTVFSRAGDEILNLMKESSLLYAFSKLAITGNLQLVIRSIFTPYLCDKSFGVSSAVEVQLITARICWLLGKCPAIRPARPGCAAASPKAKGPTVTTSPPGGL